jgi:hypothetical protein
MDAMGADLSKYDNHKVIEQNQGVLTSKPYFLINQLVDLRPKKDTHMQEKLKDSIIVKDEVQG